VVDLRRLHPFIRLERKTKNKALREIFFHHRDLGPKKLLRVELKSQNKVSSSTFGSSANEVLLHGSISSLSILKTSAVRWPRFCEDLTEFFHSENDCGRESNVVVALDSMVSLFLF